MNDLDRYFSGIACWGDRYLPEDIRPSLYEIREWGFKEGLIYESESQLLSPERMEDIKRFSLPGTSFLPLHTFIGNRTCPKWVILK